MNKDNTSHCRDEVKMELCRGDISLCDQGGFASMDRLPWVCLEITVRGIPPICLKCRTDSKSPPDVGATRTFKARRPARRSWSRGCLVPIGPPTEALGAGPELAAEGADALSGRRGGVNGPMGCLTPVVSDGCGLGARDGLGGLMELGTR